MAARKKPNVSAVPGVGPAAKPKPVKRNPAAQKISKPDTSKARPIPKSTPQPQRAPGVSAVVGKPLAKKRATAKQVRKAKGSTGAIPGVSGAVSPHLARHRVNRAKVEKTQAQIQAATGLPSLSPTRPKSGSIPKGLTGTGAGKIKKASLPLNLENLGPLGGVLGLTGVTNPKKLAIKGIKSVSPDANLSPSMKAVLFPTSPAAQAHAIKSDLPRATSATIKALKLNKPPTPGEQLTGGVSGVPGGAQIARNVGKDIVAFPQQSVTTGAAVAKAGVELAKGNTKPAGELAKGLTQGVIGNLVKGDPEAAAKYATEHPVFAALEVAGAYSAAGRGAGAVARSPVSPKAVRRAASSAREPRRISATQTKPQHYSKNVISKAVQKSREKRIARAETKPEPTIATPAKSVRKISKAARREHDKFARNQVVDVTSDTAHQVERNRREATKREIARAAPVRKNPRPVGKGKVVQKARNAIERKKNLPEQNVVDLAVEGRLRPKFFKQDLQKIHDRLVTQGAKLEGHAAKENAQQVDHIRAVMADPEALKNVKGIMESKKVFAKAANAVTADHVRTGVLTAAQAERRKLLPYAIEHMGAKEVDGRFVGPTGNALTDQAVKAHMRRSGVNPDEVAYISRQSRAANQGYYQPLVQGRGGTSKRFTGGSIEKGTGQSGYQSLVDESVRQRGQSGHIQAWDRFAGRVALKDASGKPTAVDFHRAQRLADRINEANAKTGGEDYVPVRLFAAQHEGQSAKILDRQDIPPRNASDLIQQASAEDLPPLPHETGAKIWGLVPRHQLKRLQQLERVGSTTGQKVGQAVSHQFVKTVLPFSAKWFFGNDFEAALRLAIKGVSPHDPLVARRVVREVVRQDEQAGAELQAVIGNRGFYGASSKRQNVRQTSDAYSDTTWHLPAKAVEDIRNAPVLRRAFNGLGHMQDSVLAVNSHIENLTSMGAFGKFARNEMQEMTDSWVKGMRAQEAVVRDLVDKRMLDPAKAEEAAHYLDETLGKYRRFGPDMQKVVQSVAPFLPWWLNSLRFVYWTLPVKHPALTALWTKTEATLEDEWKQEHKGVPPGDLQSAIVLDSKKVLNLAHFTPFGAFTAEAGGLANVPDIALPQLSGLFAATKGQTFFGQDIPNLSDSARWTLAINSFVSSYVPGANIIQTIAQKGHTADPKSTIFNPKSKEGSQYQSPLERIVNPLRPTFLTSSKSTTPSGGTVRKKQGVLGAKPTGPASGPLGKKSSSSSPGPLGP